VEIAYDSLIHQSGRHICQMPVRLSLQSRLNRPPTATVFQRTNTVRYSVLSRYTSGRSGLRCCRTLGQRMWEHSPIFRPTTTWPLSLSLSLSLSRTIPPGTKVKTNLFCWWMQHVPCEYLLFFWHCLQGSWTCISN